MTIPTFNIDASLQALRDDKYLTGTSETAMEGVDIT